MLVSVFAPIQVDCETNFDSNLIKIVLHVLAKIKIKRRLRMLIFFRIIFQPFKLTFTKKYYKYYEVNKPENTCQWLLCVGNYLLCWEVVKNFSYIFDNYKSFENSIKNVGFI